MQGEKKGGAGGKGVWGKIGDEFKKDIGHYEIDEDEAEAAAQDKFARQVKQKLIADKLIADELEPAFAYGKPVYPPMKYLYDIHKPEVSLFPASKDKISADSRVIIEFAYQESKHSFITEHQMSHYPY